MKGWIRLPRMVAVKVAGRCTCPRALGSECSRCNPAPDPTGNRAGRRKAAKPAKKRDRASR